MRLVWALCALLLAACWPMTLPLCGIWLGKLRPGSRCTPYHLPAAPKSWHSAGPLNRRCMRRLPRMPRGLPLVCAGKQGPRGALSASCAARGKQPAFPRRAAQARAGPHYHRSKAPGPPGFPAAPRRDWCAPLLRPRCDRAREWDAEADSLQGSSTPTLCATATSAAARPMCAATRGCWRSGCLRPTAPPRRCAFSSRYTQRPAASNGTRAHCCGVCAARSRDNSSQGQLHQQPAIDCHQRASRVPANLAQVRCALCRLRLHSEPSGDALHGLNCALRRRPDPRWQAALCQVELDVGRTPSCTCAFTKAHLTDILAVYAFKHDCEYTQVRRASASRCHKCL